jgi:hypothetical protein
MTLESQLSRFDRKDSIRDGMPFTSVPAVVNTTFPLWM